MSKPKRLVIMPAHNEAANIDEVLLGLAGLGSGADVLVVDDASTDDTASRAVERGARVVSLSCNLGYGGAVQTGFKYAIAHGYDFGVLMDADGQHDACGIADLLCAVESGAADVALGSRFLGRMEYTSGWVRRVGMRVFRDIVRRATRWPVTDPTSGFQALSREVMRFFAQDNYPTDYPDADTLIVLHHAGFRVVEVPVTMRARLRGVSMHSSLKPVYYAFKMMLSILVVLLRKQTRVNAVRPANGRPPAHERFEND